MTEFLYDAWKEIAGISTAIMLVINLYKFKNKDEKKKNSVISFVTFVLSLTLIASLITGLSFTRVPNVRGKTLAEAEQILVDSHLTPALQSGLKNNKETYNRIVSSQNYGVGELVPRNTQVKIYLGIDPDDYKTILTEVPNVVGMKYATAIELLESLKLRYSISLTGPSVSDLNKTYVVSQAFPKGLEVPEGSTMDIVLSVNNSNEAVISDVEHIVMPNVIGMDAGKASSLLLATGFSRVLMNTLPTKTNYVYKQSIEADTKVPRGSSVELETITAEIGSSVIVPDVLGKEQEEAVSILQEAGLTFMVEWRVTDTNANTDKLYVKKQSITAGTTVEAGTTILISLVTSDAI